MATCIEIARRREGHGMDQALAFDKLHRTNSKSRVDIAAVHCLSEESDEGRPNHRTSQGV